VFGYDVCCRPALYFFCVAEGADPPAVSVYSTGETAEIPKGVKLTLPREPQARSGVEAKWGTFHETNVDKTGAVRGRQFAVQDVERLARRHEQISIQPLEVTIDSLEVNNGFDPGNRGGMTLGCQSKPIRSVQFFYFEVPVVESIA
jgi:hypothetical protein